MGGYGGGENSVWTLDADERPDNAENARQQREWHLRKEKMKKTAKLVT